MVSFCVDLDTPAGASILAGTWLSFLPAVRRGDEGKAGPQARFLQPQLQPLPSLQGTIRWTAYSHPAKSKYARRLK